MLSARWVVERGLRWRIGNGNSVYIKTDRWVPKETTFRVISPLPGIANDTQMSWLIDQHSKTWNMHRLREFFLDFEAEVISSIPICPNLPNDRMVWHYTKSGKYSVKSAYHLILDQGMDVGSSSNNGRWCGAFVWNLNIPNKIKVFAWKAIQEILPTQCNLSRRRIPVDNCCYFCGASQESTTHIFVQCPFTK